MNVNNNLQGLQQLFSGQELTQAGSARSQRADQQPLSASADEATLSPAASLAAQGSADSDVRLDKVAQVQQALAAGTYNIPSAAVADRLIQHMIGQ